MSRMLVASTPRLANSTVAARMITGRLVPSFSPRILM
jgi:hypothetical protein